jgi:leader peptidase (prepilin peptidase) / N-methyltransferase
VTILTLWYEDPMVQLAIAAAIGLLWGLGADRLGARWPAHEDGSIRPLDWRTPVVAIVGAVAFAAAWARFGTDPRALLIVGAFVAALIVLFATDLDQRLLPDVLTLPMIGVAAAVTVAGWSPFIRSNDELMWAVAASVVIPLLLALLARPFGAGAIGQGDLKLLVSVGLLAGALNLFYALVAGSFLAGVVLAVLIFVRRISRKSYVPYGPFLIVGILWAILGVRQP